MICNNCVNYINKKNINIKLDCGHDLCFNCIIKIKNKSCPYCRKALNIKELNIIKKMYNNKKSLYDLFLYYDKNKLYFRAFNILEILDNNSNIYYLKGKYNFYGNGTIENKNKSKYYFYRTNNINKYYYLGLIFMNINNSKSYRYFIDYINLNTEITNKIYDIYYYLYHILKDDDILKAYNYLLISVNNNNDKAIYELSIFNESIYSKKLKINLLEKLENLNNLEAIEKLSNIYKQDNNIIKYNKYQKILNNKRNICFIETRSNKRYKF